MTTTTVLRIDASARKSGSATRALTENLIETLKPAEIVTRDLADTPLPQIDETWVGANFTPADDRTEAQKARLAQSDALVEELKAADTIVIGLPVYNFGVPAALKAWIDLVARAGVTFRYTANGPEGLLKDKRAIVAFASGGVPLGSDADFASKYLRHMLGFLGITDVKIVTEQAETAAA